MLPSVIDAYCIVVFLQFGGVKRWGYIGKTMLFNFRKRVKKVINKVK
jgi:hypothetical protein